MLFAACAPRASAAARARIGLTYLWRHRRRPDLVTAPLFTELVQLRKLHDRDPALPLLADKVAAKGIVAERLGREWVIPLLWSGEALPAAPPVHGPVVVKSRHGCNQNAFVREPGPGWDAARIASARWMRGPYGQWLDEWLYTGIPLGLLIEPWVGGGPLPVDYKFYVFGGQATHVQVHLDRGGAHRWVMMDTAWVPVAGSRAAARDAAVPPRPGGLAAMLAAAEELAQGFDFARVDFYQPGAQPLFGEMCFYPGSGLDPFDPPALDAELGALWHAAIARRLAGAAGLEPRVAAAI